MCTHLTRKASATIGFTLGVVLALAAFAVAGFGHGSYVLIGIGAAPLCLGGVLAGLVGMPILWAYFAGLSASLERRNQRLLPVLLAVHYLSAVLAVTVGPYSRWPRASGSAWAESPGWVTYATLQVFVWLQFRRSWLLSSSTRSPAN